MIYTYYHIHIIQYTVFKADYYNYVAVAISIAVLYIQRTVYYGGRLKEQLNGYKV